MKSLKTVENTGWVHQLVSIFLSQFEGLLVIFLLPLFPGLALISSAMVWRHHRKVLRGFVGVLGPICEFLAMYVLFGFSWGQYLLAGSLLFMGAVSIWGLFNPASSRVAEVAPFA
jgi:mercuric ion transport protein